MNQTSTQQMNAVAEYVATLTVAELWDICDSFDELERTGVTGETAIRIHARTYIETIGLESVRMGSSMWMTTLALEAYRRLARHNR